MSTNKIAVGYISITSNEVQYINAESLARCFKLSNASDKEKLDFIEDILASPDRAIVPKKVWFEIEASLPSLQKYKKDKESK